jgi:hypothetical protein
MRNTFWMSCGRSLFAASVSLAAKDLGTDRRKGVAVEQPHLLARGTALGLARGRVTDLSVARIFSSHPVRELVTVPVFCACIDGGSIPG